MSQITLGFCLLNGSARMKLYLTLVDLQTVISYLKEKFLKSWVLEGGRRILLS